MQSAKVFMDPIQVASKLILIQKEACKACNELLKQYQNFFIQEKDFVLEDNTLLEHFKIYPTVKLDDLNSKILLEYERDLNLIQEKTILYIKDYVTKYFNTQDIVVEHDLEPNEAFIIKQPQVHKQKRFSKEIIDILEKMYMINPYPNESEKNNLAASCGLTSKQISNWFTNKRNRSKF